MRRFLHNLRSKPADTRHKIALGTSAGITGIIFLVWVTVITQGGLIGGNQQPADTQTASPVQALQESASAALGGQTESLHSSTADPLQPADSFQSGITPPGQQQSPAQADPAPARTSSYWEGEPDQRSDKLPADQGRPRDQPANDYWQDS